jgi:hypothetical protein
MFYVPTPCSVASGYQSFFTLKLEVEGPPKHWYPTTTTPFAVTIQKTSTWRCLQMSKISKNIITCLNFNSKKAEHVNVWVKRKEGWAMTFSSLYEGRLQSSWTHLFTPSRNFVEVRWRSLFLRSTSLGKRCTSYNAPTTSQKWSYCRFKRTLFSDGGETLAERQRCAIEKWQWMNSPIRWNPIRTSTIQSRSRAMRFLGFSNHEKGDPR